MCYCHVEVKFKYLKTLNLFIIDEVLHNHCRLASHFTDIIEKETSAREKRKSKTRKIERANATHSQTGVASIAYRHILFLKNHYTFVFEDNHNRIVLWKRLTFMIILMKSVNKVDLSIF